jgi:translation elongation factor EF-Tu-like GTPase
MSGAISNEESWLAKVKELETKVSESEKKAAEKNTEIVEKVVTKTQVIKEKGDDIIKYVDREVVKKEEVVKFVENCPIPNDIINAHNAAASLNKK